MLKSSYTIDLIEAGCDEVGRGCLAGPVVAAAVILPKNYSHEILNDSKQLNKEERLILTQEIQRDAISWGIAEVSNEEIDKINILNASFKAMHRALDKLTTKPNLLLIDGNRFQPYGDVKFECVIKGDATYLSIAAASVLAKTYRDELMEKLSEEYPGYAWESNVGYPTVEHRDGIRSLGITPYHRRSFQLLPSQLELFT
ncbi:MAG TPA: ribonuclease HII [Cyclobacteriaceae bacterium]|nr:ribonuclease HII [Cyclobacteriaceae bacterium]